MAIGKKTGGRKKGTPNKNSKNTFLRYIHLDGKYIVYVINAENTDFYKIGRTRSISKRMRTANGFCPHKLNLIHYVEFDSIKDMQVSEKRLHAIYRDNRIKLEWFELNIEQLKDIKKLTDFEDIDNLERKVFGKIYFP
ncbi:MAG: GIY-YIG nuclease family protein [Arenibacter latericius]|nr:GIY-YIG nuclease family protein [Arenibacter latericius]